MDDLTIGFIGAGTLAGGLSMALAAREYRVAAVSSRSHSSAESLATRIPGCQPVSDAQELADRCRLVFITTPDDTIGGVATQVVWSRGQGVVHCSGAQSLEALEAARRLGATTGSFHPFQTFACLKTPQEAMERLDGASFAVEGEGWLLDFLKKLASDLGGKAIAIKPEDRAIYHISAVMSCGYLVALLNAATHLWSEMGITRDEALSSMLPMARTTLANVARDGTDTAVTGPLMRGDTATLKGHLQALDDRMPQLIPLYCALALESLALAAEKVSPEVLESMKRLMNDHLRNHVSQAGS